MSVVLDTNVLVWALEGDKALGSRAARLIDQAVIGGVAHVSAISFWELGLRIREGKFGLAIPLSDWRAQVLRLGVREVPVDGTIGVTASELQDLHFDPTDRLIVATALRLGASLATSDARLLAWKGPLACIDARV
ncbi:PIN domain nuclease, a component of toxin-antitoxin system (PIN domain) [Enhydrobacter aerosaccus]|uniref:PIN domain nuclease, a component of toxin-antitoxin system (PIN domain) n=1 Tax=Enhydrobacter aerosaccus TaxID=225324 RepID=A0A1T4S7B7_9HYPH|nr:type II toxin-antitoxin system VapC family toxin [Enhydrobacter aerosaccus]SKA24159.1 PIN domain nuclease, a component of toxin-antitoxin system (PIN domain) [Enhydrobacter aerosaccus]